MKSILTFFSLLLMASNVFGQNTNVFQDNMDVIYQNVNRTHVTTGLLKDYGLLLTDISKFNGTRQANNYVNHPVWSSLYASLYFMKFNSNATLPAPNVVNSAVATYKTTDSSIVNLLALHFTYEQFKTNAASSNLVYVANNKIYDTPNRPATPYEIKNAFAVAPLTDVLVGGSHTFRFRNELSTFTVVCGGGGQRFAFYPNPTSDVLTVSILSSDDSTALQPNQDVYFETKLFDSSGKLWLEGNLMSS